MTSIFGNMSVTAGAVEMEKAADMTRSKRANL
jgi:hypothetical protein